MTSFTIPWLYPIVHLYWRYSKTAASRVVSGIFLWCSVPLLLLSVLSQHLLKRGGEYR